MKKRIFTLFTLVIFFSLSAWAQSTSAVEIAKEALAERADEFGLDAQEVADFIVSDQYVSSSSNATHVYLWQTVNGIPVHNALVTIGIKDGVVYNIKSNAVRNIYNKLAVGTAVLDAEAAIRASAELLGYRSVEYLAKTEEKGANSFVYAPTSFAKNNIRVYQCYEKNTDGQYELSWNVNLDVPGKDYFSLRISAQDGRLLKQNNYSTTIDLPTLTERLTASHLVRPEGSSVRSSLTGSYLVYPFPTESPNHGSQEFIINPADTNASPFGWHDTNGAEGAEFTITRGNNSHVFLDADGDDAPDEPEPDGGLDLIFDFVHLTDEEPDTNRMAAQVNLFYATNYLHDLTYRLGFDEAAGNFQQNNYGNGGVEGDYVIAQVADLGSADGATFTTAPDGENATIEMGLWGASPLDLLNVNSPSQLEAIYEVQPASFGAPIIETTMVTGNLVVVDDGTPSSSEGCEALINGDQLMGNIALIDRGSCEFGLKSLNAQQAGAVAVIVCNIAGVNGGDGSEIITMGGGAVGGEVTIPAVMCNLPNCNLFKASINSGVPVNVTIQQPQVTGPENLNSSFDNGVTTYMYTLGVSDRIVGGPDQVECLDNAEEMAVGWSDFFILATTARAGDDGTEPRGIFTYANGEDTDGRGSRTFPYSTDIEVFDRTHADAVGGSAFDVGEVWAGMLWDMYWAMVEEYGFDEDLSNLESGNAKAMRLVIEGMKEIPCSPSLTDARDGIIAADEALYGGENFCIIYNTFARRGLGFDSFSGDSDDWADNVEGFLSHPDCLDELLISKSATPVVGGGEEVEIDIEVTNYKKDPVTDLTVTDIIPAGATFVDGSGNYTSSINNEFITFTIGEVAENEVITVSYRILVDAGLSSSTFVIDDFSDGFSAWDIELTEGSLTFWNLSDTVNSPGGLAFYIPATAEEQVDISLISNAYFPVSGTRPALRFDNAYNTEFTSDGGFVMVREEGQEGWERLSIDDNIRNGYPPAIFFYGGVYAFAELSAFTGNSGGWVDTYLDLSEYAGKNIQFRFRFGNDDNTIVEGNIAGWAIDNFEIMDLVELSSDACATAGGDDPVCASASTIVESGGTVSVDELSENGFAMELFPNPADEEVIVRIVSKANGPANLRLVTLEGKTVRSDNTQLIEGFNVLNLGLAGLPSGIYFVELTSDASHSVQKLIVK